VVTLSALAKDRSMGFAVLFDKNCRMLYLKSINSKQKRTHASNYMTSCFRSCLTQGGVTRSTGSLRQIATGLSRNIVFPEGTTSKTGFAMKKARAAASGISAIELLMISFFLKSICNY